MADFSNYGRCVKIFAPGVDIVSIGINGKATSVQSGTSMAAPHISGIAAVYMSNKNYGSVKEVIADLQSNAARDLIKNAKGSANLVAYLPGGRSGRSSNAREDAAPDMPQENSGNPPTESADMNTPDNAPAPSDEQALMTQPESNIPFFQTAINNIINSLTKQDKTGMMSVNRKKKTDEERLLTTPLTAAELQAQADEDLLKQAA
jgi:subtilisin family serine protease